MKQLDTADIMIPDVFQSHGTYRRDREAVVCGDVRRNWGDFSDNMNRVANALLQAGIGKGDRVAVLMGNSVEMLEVMFGIVKAGACVVPLSGLLTGAQLAGLIEDSGARAAFATPDFIERLAPHAGELRTLAAAHRYVVHGQAPGWHFYSEFVALASTSAPCVVHASGDDFNIIYSSGTTGLPKGIVQSHRARTHWAVSNAFEMRIGEHSRALTTTSLYSNGTWLMMLPVLFSGGTCVVMPAFDAGRFMRLLHEERITHTFMVPAQYIAVLQQESDGTDLDSLEVLLCAGSPLRKETKRQVIERFGDKLIELYGYSEGFASMLKPGAPAEKFNTVGTPVLGFEVRVIDDEGRVLPPGAVGEIAGYGAGMMSRYHGKAQATADLIWLDERGRTFIRSGDIGYQDADGYLVLVDRKKDMIISGGFNVFPADIEEIVGQHPDVLDVTVIGVPHERWGETPLALVIMRGGARLDDAPLVAWCNERLAKHQRICGVEARDEFPRNALGKVLKRLLREPYWALNLSKI
ncbi:MAG: AMP-dependent synthetase [Comamonadaceae bacterium]|nr:MAG: AMP-dependent synthetase [Comamonadaceae bacterium]